MRSNRPQGAASHPRGHHVRSVLVRVLSVTAMAAAACTLWAGAASAAPTLFGTKTVVTVSPTTADVGATVKLSATVTSPGRIPAGIVTFTWDSFVLCSARTHYGVATCNTTFSLARSYTIEGQFARTRYYWGSYGVAKVTVVNPTKNATTTTAGPATAAAGTVLLTGSVYAMGANIIDGGGSLAFSNGTTAITGCAAVPLSVFTGGDNVGTCMTTLAAGTYTIKVVYSGDVVNEPSSGTVTLVVS